MLPATTSPTVGHGVVASVVSRNVELALHVAFTLSCCCCCCCVVVVVELNTFRGAGVIAETFVLSCVVVPNPQVP